MLHDDLAEPTESEGRHDCATTPILSQSGRNPGSRTSGQDRLLGCHIVAENAGDMIHEAVAMMAARTPVKVVAKAMHAYPTLSELMRSALRGAGG